MQFSVCPSLRLVHIHTYTKFRTHTYTHIHIRICESCAKKTQLKPTLCSKISMDRYWHSPLSKTPRCTRSYLLSAHANCPCSSPPRLASLSSVCASNHPRTAKCFVYFVERTLSSLESIQFTMLRLVLHVGVCVHMCLCVCVCGCGTCGVVYV